MAVKQIITKINNTDYTFDIAYEIINPGSQDTVVFLHGWGSNKEIMKQAFEKEFDSMKHLYVDMPGFGKSTCDVALTTKDYAQIMQTFFKQLKTDVKIIAGHSFGGKVATLLNPPLLLLLSTAGIIEEKSDNVKFKIKMAKVLNSLGLSFLGKFFRSKDVNTMNETMYQTFKNVVDEDFSNIFKNYSGQTKIFWGKNDTATSLKSGQTIHNLIQNSEFKAYDSDHYFFLHHAKDIATCTC
ncbi:MAG: alpha/beta hydrolase [Campylobacterota bacterium]|nr:alpha/beta hydrolase [Campylobacterota bacterium]